MIVHVKDAGVGSVPTPLTARTWNVWLPSASPSRPAGSSTRRRPPPSSAHSNVAPAGVEVKLKLALVLVVDVAGDEVIVVSGGTEPGYSTEYAPA